MEELDLQLFASNPEVPTSENIYIRIIWKGKSRIVAAVQSFSDDASQETGHVESFGEEQPIATYKGSKKTEYNMSRIQMLKDAYNDGIFFEDLEDFETVVEYPDRDEVFSSCNWSSIKNDIQLGEPIQTDVSVMAGPKERIMK